MICEICGKHEDVYGHNPWPLKGNFCCTECNEKYVIPARIMIKQRQKEQLE